MADHQREYPYNDDLKIIYEETLNEVHFSRENHGNPWGWSRVSTSYSTERLNGISKALNNLELRHIVSNNRDTVNFEFHDLETFREAKKFIEMASLEYQSFMQHDNKFVKVVLRGLPVTGKLSQLRSMMVDAGFPVKYVKLLKSQGKVYPLYVLYYLRRQTSISVIFSMTHFNGYEVQVELFRDVQLPVQCYNCQKFGHISTGCRASSRCVKCAASHHTRLCPTRTMTAPICCNCGGNHSASYRACPYFLFYDGIFFQNCHTEYNSGPSNSASGDRHGKTFPKEVFEDLLRMMQNGMMEPFRKWCEEFAKNMDETKADERNFVILEAIMTCPFVI